MPERSRYSFEPEREMITSRLQDVELVPFERDQTFIMDVMNRLSRTSDIEMRYRAFKYLDQLVPHWENQDGHSFRQIADIPLTLGIEKLIKSRWEAHEVDTVAYLNAFPEDVRNFIFSGDMIIEFTDCCTVACDFCAVSKKGPIQHKMSSRAIANLFQAFTTTRRNRNSADTINYFHYNTDPFDWREVRWEGNQLVDLDIVDIYEGVLYTSLSSRPIGIDKDMGGDIILDHEHSLSAYPRKRSLSTDVHSSLEKLFLSSYWRRKSSILPDAG